MIPMDVILQKLAGLLDSMNGHSGAPVAPYIQAFSDGIHTKGFSVVLELHESTNMYFIIIFIIPSVVQT